MLRRDMVKALGIIPLTAAIPPILAEARTRNPLNFSCGENNDLYRLAASSGISCRRYENVKEAVSDTPRGSSLLVLAEHYPSAATHIDLDIYGEAIQKRLHLYVEFPSSLPNISVGKPQLIPLGEKHNVLQRVVVTSNSFAPALKKMCILSLHECYYTPISAQKSELVLARVAGFDTAIFGLPQEDVHPVLFEHPEHNILVATTKLSSFIEGRYDPAGDWAHVWRWILSRLSSGQPIVLQKWASAVHPAFGRSQPLSEQAEIGAFRRGIAWYRNARLFVAPQWKHYIGEYAKSGGLHPGPQVSWPLGWSARSFVPLDELV
jgi:hypothetical protein